MRTWVATFVVLAAPAMAQEAPVLDGKATLSGQAGEMVTAGPATKEQVRGLIVAALTDKISAEELDFFRELASGGAVDTAAGGKMVRVGPLGADALTVAKLIVAPPNLNTLYKSHGEPMLQMLEMSRWGDAAKNRVSGFMANKLYAAWMTSSVNNAYRDWVPEYLGIVNAMDTIADPAMKTEAKLLLKSAIEQVFAKCKADGREPPPLFLYDLALIPVGVPRPQ